MGTASLGVGDSDMVKNVKKSDLREAKIPINLCVGFSTAPARMASGSAQIYAGESRSMNARS